MKFITNIQYTTNTKDRVYIKQEMYDYFKSNLPQVAKSVMCTFFVSAIIKTTEDFYIDLDDDIIQTCSDSCSVQYRPKAIYKNNKGYFYKLNNSQRVYLKQESEKELLEYIEIAKKFNYD
ncbi:MAG: hypothetical protein [Caudoviricetes sp.]|nr:MAG: hypothetical protein [Caudoviricetes sp.]